MPWAELDAALQKGDGEAIIAGVAVTPETRQLYAFSRPYLVFPARFVTTNARALAEPLFDKCAARSAWSPGRRMSACCATISARSGGHFRQTGRPSRSEGRQDRRRLRRRHAVGLLAGRHGRRGCCRFSGGPYIAPEFLGTGLAIARQGDNPALAAAFDYALQAISAKGTFGELYLRYFPVSFF